MSGVKVIDQSGRVLKSEQVVHFYGDDLRRRPYISCDDGYLTIEKPQVVTLEFEDGSKFMANINLNWRNNIAIANVALINQNGIELARTNFGTDNLPNEAYVRFSFAIWLPEKDGHNFVIQKEIYQYKRQRKDDIHNFNITQTLFDYNGKKLADDSFSATDYGERNEKARASREKLFNMASEQEC